MKKLLGISLLVLIYSCNNETIKNETIKEEPTTPSTIVEPIIDTVADTSNLAVQENSITIKDIPKKWYKLNLQESKQYTINEWCEIQSSTIEIEPDDNVGWRILVTYPTDSKEFKIIGFEASKTTTDFESIISGHFIIENPEYPDMDPEIYSFSWNKGMMYATFGGFFENECRMVSESNKNFYELVVENCDYLDEDQER